MYYTMSDSQDTNDITNSMTAIAKRYQGISSKIGYHYRDTYLIDFNLGYTGSENFEPGRRFGFFPSLAVGWVPSQYDFVKASVPWLDFFKIRASYGKVGNDRLAGNQRFPYLTLVSEGQQMGWGYSSTAYSGGGVT